MKDAGRIILAATITLVFSALAPAQAQTDQQRVPLYLEVFVDCAYDGLGETVVLEGTIHFTFHAKFDSAGGLHIHSLANPQGVRGYGQLTGDKYQGTGVAKENFTLLPGQTSTFIDNFRIIGQGPGNNLLIHQNTHYTINANGDITAEVDNFSAECK